TVLLLASCNLSPEFKKPEMKIPQQFKNSVKNDNEVISEGSWKLVELDENSERGQWWKIFNDEKLNKYQEIAKQNNNELAAAIARVEQARGNVDLKRGAFFPTLTIGASPSRFQQSNVFLGKAQNADQFINTIYRTEAVVSYEPDLFGRIRNNYNIANFSREASEGALKSVMLALQADVATMYFNLRTIDEEISLIEIIVEQRAQEEKIFETKLKLGDVSYQEYLLYKAELASSNSEKISLLQKREEIVNNFAVLLGQNPSLLELERLNLSHAEIPQIPANLPSKLLERRPDINIAVKQLEAANEKIGLARTAFFPNISLSASGGFESNQISDMFKWSARTWTLGPLFGTLLTAPLFEGGRGFANLDIAKSAYSEAVAHYRQSVLVAFKDVENALSAIKYLNQQSDEVITAYDASQKSADLQKLKFENGSASLPEYLFVERNRLEALRAFNQIRGAKFIAAISLIRALGGGFNVVASAPVNTPDDVVAPIIK
ncbi:MAG TPA: RND transporter, partial [Alphaproteobacteria bacterium]|nr:RND transporter [Alphaproteobacteria bacterium]